MKIMATVSKYGGDPNIVIDHYAKRFFFEGEAPQVEKIIVLILPGLPAVTSQAVQEWIIRYHLEHFQPPGEAPLTSRKQKLEIPQTCWRPATLDDFLDSAKWESSSYSARQNFSLEEIHDFTSRWHDDTLRRLNDVIATPSGNERRNALAAFRDRIRRVHRVLSLLPERVDLDFQIEVERLDRLRLQAIQIDKHAEPERWIAELAQITTTQVLQEGLHALARLIKKPKWKKIQRLKMLRAIASHANLNYAAKYDKKFWQILGPCFPLPRSTTGVKVNLTEAHEVRLDGYWDLLTTRLIGPVRLGRKALAAVNQKDGSVRCYVRGERKLLFKIANAGGTLKKYGCLLTIDLNSRQSLKPRLMEMERLDTLSQVDPLQAVQSIAHLKLPADHLVYRTAQAACHNSRQARLLADLLIELKFGIDPDVARHLSRINSRHS